MSGFSRWRIALNLLLILMFVYGALRLINDTLYIYNANKAGTVNENPADVFKLISLQNETTEPQRNAVRFPVVHQTNIPTDLTPKPKPLPPMTVIVSNRSVIPTVPPLPAKVSIVKGNTDTCRLSKNLKWIIYVHTAPINQKKRDAIRNTWGNKYLFDNRRTAVIFLVGLPRHKGGQKIIDEEYNRYGDIVQGDFIDDYRNLTYKGILGLQFISSYCSHVPYAIKSDDDVFANIFKIMQLSEERGSNSRFLVCLRWHGMPIRRPATKIDYETWWLPNDVLPNKKVFEPYCAGMGWIFSTNIAKDLVTIAYRTPFLWIDDVYISGMVMNQVKNLTKTNLAKVVDMETMFDRIPLPFNASDFVFSEKNPKLVRQFWNRTLNQLHDEILQELNITALTQYPILLHRRGGLSSDELTELDKVHNT